MEISYKKLLENNKTWVNDMTRDDPDYFKKMSKGQSPEYLWIGCSDSRVPANEVTGTKPGELFVHRNIANMVVHNDLNLLSVLAYAVEVLKVKHIIVCGHYGCGGVEAAMSNRQYGLIDHWLRNIKEVYRIHQDELEEIDDYTQRLRRFVELNVVEQVRDLSKTPTIQNAWRKGQQLYIHGWVYDIHNGFINDLEVSYTNANDLPEVFKLEASH
ncbi:MAG: carbonate dehydratase [Chitinophagaceae bacterium]|nr:carbonate dehydratase [Chitinophagaceae bacterium]